MRETIELLSLTVRWFPPPPPLLTRATWVDSRWRTAAAAVAAGGSAAELALAEAEVAEILRQVCDYVAGAASIPRSLWRTSGAVVYGLADEWEVGMRKLLRRLLSLCERPSTLESEALESTASAFTSAVTAHAAAHAESPCLFLFLASAFAFRERAATLDDALADLHMVLRQCAPEPPVALWLARARAALFMPTDACARVKALAVHERAFRSLAFAQTDPTARQGL